MIPIVVLLLAVVGYMLVCTISGMQPVDIEIAEFLPDLGTSIRVFGDSPESVRSAYIEAASEVPGMSVIRRTDQSILIDMKPTTLVMDGSYGLLLLALFSRSESGTLVTLIGQKKVSFAWAPRSHAAFVQAERTLRMRAKRTGINELVTGS